MAEPATIYSAQLNYLNEITADEIIVVFNGTTYTVPKRTRTLPNSDVHTYYGTLGLVDDGNATGDYPFCIYEAHDLNTVYVSEDVYNNHNPFTIKIIEDSVTTTECFEKAVQSVASPLVVQASRAPSEGTRSVPSVLYASSSEIQDALKTRGVVVEDPHNVVYSVLSATNVSVTIAMGVYNSTTQQTDFSVFCYTNSANVLRYPPDAIA